MPGTPIPLGLSAYERPSGFQPEVKLVNLYIEKDASGASTDEYFRLQRPGLAPYATLPSTVRGMFYRQGVGDDLPLVAAGTHVYAVDGATNASIGTISNDNLTVSMAASAFGHGIVSDGTFYFYDGATLATIAMPDDVEPIDVDTIDSYFILPLSNGVFYWMEPGATTVDALSFFEAESSPDGLVGIKVLNSEIFFFGGSTIEVWQTTGSADAPFQRAGGRDYLRGCLAKETIQVFDNSIVFVGDDARVYRIAGQPQQISNPGIEERLRLRTGDPSALVVPVEGHLFYVLTIPGQGTFAHDAATGQWSQWQSHGQATWKPTRGLTLANGTVLAGDATSGKVWWLDPTRSNDDGAPLDRIVSGSIVLNGRPRRNDSLTLFTGASAPVDFTARWTTDGQGTWTSPRTISAKAGVDNPSVFRLGQANQPVRTFEVSCSADTKIRISGAMLNGAWR